MRSAPSLRAWSRNALNLISALHSTSGLGVRPARYSRRNSAKTRSLYSAAKLTCSSSMPITSATLAASRKSWRDEQYSSSSSSSQFFMKMATTSQPCDLSRCAVTAESTPPLRPTTTRVFAFICAIIPRAPYPHALSACHPAVSARPPVAVGAGHDDGDPCRDPVAAAAVLAAGAHVALRGVPICAAAEPIREREPRDHADAAQRNTERGPVDLFERARLERADESDAAVA